ncbi:hypothetical protein L596_029170 [Steinernema carpocapsae]|uniref:Major facilitator superfamily (MFS) profile domain-containing protein n=1 Tax=Steinernema carpocapsae TaxID=34508 RepID=A0A4U5LTV6_STECR|nr:hypothetical protein L596_029170 [Steinernema carpocapsae]
MGIKSFYKVSPLEPKPPVKQQKTPFRDSTRFVILVLCILCMTLVLANTLTLNFTIICMGGSVDANGTSIPRFDEKEKGWLFSAVAIGCLIGTIPITELFTRFGARKVKTAYGLISAVATLLSPLAVNLGFYYILVIRAIQGFALTMTFSASGAVTAQWATLSRSGIYVALLSCHLQFAPIFAMPTAAGFCVSSVGWTGVYYLQGGLTILAFALFFYFFRDTPRKHKNVSSKELGKLEAGKTGLGQKNRTPYLTICRDIVIIGTWVSWIGGSIAFQIFLQYGPTYLNKVLGMDVAKTGGATAIPYFLSFLIKVMAGPFSDRATCISERARLILFTIVSQGTMATCFIVLALLPVGQVLVGWIMYAAAIVASGLSCVGVFKCAHMVSRQYLTFVMSVFSIINSCSVLVLPFFVSYMVPTNTSAEWAVVFYIICGVVIATNAFFCIVCRADAASWTKDAPEEIIQEEEKDNEWRLDLPKEKDAPEILEKGKKVEWELEKY